MSCFACGNYNIVLTCHIVTFTHTRARTHARTHTHTDLNFLIFWKDHEIKYTSNCDNASPQNLIYGNSYFLRKTSDLRKFLSKLREIN